MVYRYLFLIARTHYCSSITRTHFPNTLWHIKLINSSQSHFGNKRVNLALAYHLVYWHYTLRLYWSNTVILKHYGANTSQMCLASWNENMIRKYQIDYLSGVSSGKMWVFAVKWKYEMKIWKYEFSRLFSTFLDCFLKCSVVCSC